MQTSDARVTTRIVHTDDGQTFTEYEVGNVAVSSTDALEAMLTAR
jgi:hypothetical protein